MNKSLAQRLNEKSGLDFSVNINPENYFINQRIPVGPTAMGFNLSPSQPIVGLSLKF